MEKDTQRQTVLSKVLRVKLPALFFLLLHMWCGVISAGEQPNELSAETLLPLKARQHPFVFTEGEREGERLILTLSRKEGDSWKMGFGSLLTAELFHDTNGELRLRRLINNEENSIIRYRPAVLLLPAHLRPDVTISQQVEMTEIDSRTGEISRRSMVSHRLSSVSEAAFYTPAGRFEGLLVQLEQQGSFDVAKVTARFAGGFVPHFGLVQAQLTYTVDKPLFFGSTSTYFVELAENPGEK